jgi:DNA-binding LacI/PurR family transcriptional regulator
MPPQPTQRDVAARAGVSRALVSLVMRDSPLVSDGRRAAVLKAARELGYRTNAAASALATSRTHTLGVMVQDLHNPFFAEVVDGIRAAADDAGYRILINTGLRRPDVELASIETFLELRMDGVIIASPLIDDAQLDAIGGTVPTVVIGRTVESAVLDTVHTDEHLGACLAVRHLHGLGHTDIAYIDSAQDVENTSGLERRAGYESAMRDAGLGAYIRSVRAGADNDGGVAVRRILHTGQVPTAVFAYNDVAAVAAQERLIRAGLRVPEDVSIVGYDNTFLAALGHVSLTSVDQPRQDMGRLALEFLLQRLNGRTDPRSEIVAPTLVARTSTARRCPRRAAETPQRQMRP